MFIGTSVDGLLLSRAPARERDGHLAVRAPIIFTGPMAWFLTTCCRGQRALILILAAKHFISPTSRASPALLARDSNFMPRTIRPRAATIGFLKRHHHPGCFFPGVPGRCVWKADTSRFDPPLRLWACSFHLRFRRVAWCDTGLRRSAS